MAVSERALATVVDGVGVDPQVTAAMRIRAQLDTVRNVLAPDLNDMELQLFSMVAQRSRLDPFAKQIYAIKRQGKLTFQTGIDGFRSSAEETGEYRGSDEPEYGPMIDKPFPHPEWARVVVHREYPDGGRLDQPATAHWDEFYPGDSQGFQWKKMPRVMLAKVAEAAAFRKAFPKRFGEIYTAEEMQQADAAPVPVSVAPTASQRAAARLAAVQPDEPQVPVASGDADQPPVVAGPSPSPASDVVEGEAREVTPAWDEKTFRRWLADRYIGITDAQKHIRATWGDDQTIGGITDEQRAQTAAAVAHLAK